MLYMVRRNVPGVTQVDVDAAFLRARSCAYSYEGLRWVTSYWDRDAGIIHCVWEAQNPEQIEDHSRRARIPCDDIRPVLQFSPEDVRPEETAVEA